MIFQICKNFAVILSQVTTGGCVIPKEESISRERNNAMQKKKMYNTEERQKEFTGYWGSKISGREGSNLD